jgi:hypothetical protein
MKFISFDEARRAQKQSPCPRWSASPADRERTVGRFSERFFPVALGAPKFSAGREEHFFMIGSCFARGLEAALSSQKFSVLSKTTAFDRWAVDTQRNAAAGATNKYNLGSIENEFAWAFGERAFPEAAIIPLDDDKYYDPHMTPVFAPSTRDEILAKRQAMTRVVRLAKDADVVVITLGLVEVWKDAAVDLITNSTPNPLACRKQPDRFLFGRLDYSANMQLLENIYAMLQHHGRKGFRLVVTVSPVPLEATFTDRDVVTATAYSKSLLRVVAEDFALGKRNVEYFPSYEIVMNSPRPNAWIEDCRHVRGELANFIMSKFIGHFIPDLHLSARERLLTTEYLG